MLRWLSIKNFKSVVDLTVELGRFNLFIGENGCGKSNILEALGMAGAAADGRLENDDLFSRGIRVAKPSLRTNAFAGIAPSGEVKLRLEHDEPQPQRIIEHTLGLWTKSMDDSSSVGGVAATKPLAEKMGNDDLEVLLSPVEPLGELTQRTGRLNRHPSTAVYIFTADTLSLRGLQVQSRRTPVGIFGEGLDVAIAQLPQELRDDLINHARMISWFDDIDIDQQGVRRLAGFKPGRSQSDLYFVDRFLDGENNVFSVENANEGILHVLFHLVLFIHPKTPRILAIDNIEVALNPHLLRRLVASLSKLAAQHDKQALVTTHNPAALDGLNLHDDDQRLFVVSRNDDGHTQAKRIQVKPDESVGGTKLKLSELWMRGMIGGIPTHF